MPLHAIPSIIKHFKIEGRFSNAKSYGSGHIHDTYLIRTENELRGSYLLQRINQHVFKNVPELMSNIERVVRHIRKKLSYLPGANPDRECLTLVSTVDERAYHRDDAGACWRVYKFIEHSHCFDLVDSPKRAYQGGKAFGKFQALVCDLPAEMLCETIPDFHDIEHRLRVFFDTVKRDPLQRAKEVMNELRMVEKRADEMKLIHRLADNGDIPLRVTHNDTKFNNVLFDEAGEALCVIDLDTVMPGYIHYDFGDAIRSCANTGTEDEPDLSRVRMDIKRFEAFTKAFLAECGTLLVRTEIDTLAFSARLMTFIMGLRFLTDYLDGDHYYKVRFAKHNLQRARVQFKLLTGMDQQYDEMRSIVEEGCFGTSASMGSAY